MKLREGGTTWNIVGDEVVILDLEGSVYLKLNGSGRVLWERLADGCTEDDLVASLIDTYAIEAELATTDVRTFLAQLNERGLVVDE